MKKKTFKNYPVGSVMYVMAHAEWQKKHRRNPSMTFANILNPKKALSTARTYFAVNTEDGIEQYLKNLKGLNKLIDLRRDLGYNLDFTHHEFIILGRFLTDVNGSFSRISEEFIPKEHMPFMPDVMWKEHFCKLMQEYDRVTKPDVLTKEEMKSRDFNWEKTQDHILHQLITKCIAIFHQNELSVQGAKKAGQ